MRIPAVAMLTIACLVAAAAEQDDAAKLEMKKLQGAWKTVAVESEGQKIEPPAELASTVVIKGDTYTVTAVTETGQKVVSELTFRVGHKKNPKEIDFTTAAGPDKGKRIKGIYQLKGDTLQVCFNPKKDGERPTAFTTKAGSSVRLNIFKREKP
jgi:uncharacterized protein (TIGR03067 family)